MIKPITITEHLLFSTLRLETSSGVGTGFYFVFDLEDNKKIPVIITNKHVLNGNSNEDVQFSLHYVQNDRPSEEVINIIYSTNWIFHDYYDLAFTFINPLFEQIKTQGKQVFMIPITEELIWKNDKLEELTSVENVLMFGYPIGLYDHKNILPLIRNGITSSHPAIDYNGEKIGVVDMACFPGSSGSPIFIINEGNFTDKKKKALVTGNRIIFLGILYSGPVYNSKGEIIVENIPTQQVVRSVTPQMINLGYYIKAQVILDFKSTIKEIIEEKNT